MKPQQATPTVGTGGKVFALVTVACASVLVVAITTKIVMVLFT